MFEDVWGLEDPDDVPVELLERIRLAFLMLQSGVILKKTEDHFVLKVDRALYEDFFSPMSEQTIQ